MPSIISNRSIIMVTGTESTKFLQNLVTNDVMLLKEASVGQYAMMLSPQGRFLFDMFIIHINSGYLLDIFTDTKDLLLKKLRMYKINLQVEIEDMQDWWVGYIADGSSISDAIACYKDPRYEAMGYRIVNTHHCELPEMVRHTYLRDKYLYTIPDGGIELLYDKAMPQEYGAEQLNAISYTKGCYVGQEVISRTKSQGVVRKKIYKILSEHNLDDIAYGTEIMQDGNKVGVVCSGYKNEGIALIREENLLSSDGASIFDFEVQLVIAKWYG